MVAVLFLLLAANTPASTSDFANQIGAVEVRTGARIGVAARDTGSGKSLDYRSQERFPMCSTFKFLAAAAVLRRIDDGNEKLDRFVSYGAKDILEYAPVTKSHLKEGGMTLAALCAAAIEQSDNTAGNLLLDIIGGPAGLTNFVRTIGHTSSASCPGLTRASMMNCSDGSLTFFRAAWPYGLPGQARQ